MLGKVESASPSNVDGRAGRGDSPRETLDASPKVSMEAGQAKTTFAHQKE